MTIGERLDRLTKRHEALTQSVELLFHTQDRHSKELDRLGQMQAKDVEAQAKNETLMAQAMESIASLARIAHVHEDRISGLEAT